MADRQLSSPPALVVVKIGGSLFSDKRQARTLDAAALDRYAAAMASLWRAAPGRVAFVSGGGAFGHDAVRFLDLDDPDATLPLTEAMFTLKWLWTKALRSHGCRAVPLQVASIACRDRKGLLQVADQVPQRLLGLGILPVLSGDAICDAQGSLEVLGSDRAAAVLLGLRRGPVRVAMLTDVPGILLDGPGGTEVLREVDPECPEPAALAVWETPPWDTSRSMRGKLEAAIALSREGAECLIMEGRPSHERLRLLLDPWEAWPASMPCTRIGPIVAGTASID
jgi:isopentenyl phosphate kinase